MAAAEPRARLERGRERVPVGPPGVAARGEDREDAERGGGVAGEGEVGDEGVERVRAARAGAEPEQRADGVRRGARRGGEVPGEMREDGGVRGEARGEEEGLDGGERARRERARAREDGAEGDRHTRRGGLSFVIAAWSSLVSERLIVRSFRNKKTLF